MMVPVPVARAPDLGRRLLLLRRLRGVASQAAAARLVGVKTDRYGSWEQGRVLPRAAELPRLAAAFGVTVDWLLTGATAGLTRETWALLSVERSAPPPRRGRPPTLGRRENAEIVSETA